MNPYGWLSKHQSGEAKVDGMFVVMMAAYLRRPIQILSHTDAWSSDANIDGAVTLIFAGDNDFTAVEVGTAVVQFILLWITVNVHCNSAILFHDINVFIWLLRVPGSTKKSHDANCVRFMFVGQAVLSNDRLMKSVETIVIYTFSILYFDSRKNILDPTRGKTRRWTI